MGTCAFMLTYTNFMGTLFQSRFWEIILPTYVYCSYFSVTGLRRIRPVLRSSPVLFYRYGTMVTWKWWKLWRQILKNNNNTLGLAIKLESIFDTDFLFKKHDIFPKMGTKKYAQFGLTAHILVHIWKIVMFLK